MDAENHETSNGWPLGLQIMSMRLPLQERLQAAAPAVEVEPYSLDIPSSSFSSFSSSNLDTEVIPGNLFFLAQQSCHFKLSQLAPHTDPDISSFNAYIYQSFFLFHGAIGQSSASFFQDNSVSLGKLIGFRPGERGSLYLQSTIRTEQSSRLPVRGACSCMDVSKGHGADTSQGICIPLILGALVKISRNKIKSKRLDDLSSQR